MNFVGKNLKRPSFSIQNPPAYRHNYRNRPSDRINVRRPKKEHRVYTCSKVTTHHICKTLEPLKGKHVLFRELQRIHERIKTYVQKPWNRKLKQSEMND